MKPMELNLKTIAFISMLNEIAAQMKEGLPEPFSGHRILSGFYFDNEAPVKVPGSISYPLIADVGGEDEIETYSNYFPDDEVKVLYMVPDNKDVHPYVEIDIGETGEDMQLIIMEDGTWEAVGY